MMAEEEIISTMWCCGLAWRCTTSEAIGIWSVILFYSSIAIVSVVHVAMLQSRRHEAVGENTTPNNNSGYSYYDDDFGFLLALLVYFFTFAAGCLVWVINPHWVHPLQIWQIQILGSVVMFICLFLFVRVHIEMGDNWYPIPNTPPQLVTNGVFRYARHPMYAIFIWASIGTMLATLNLVITWCVSGIVLVTLPRIKTEERILVDFFGDRYIEYQRHVPSLGTPWQCLGFDGELLNKKKNRADYNVVK